MIQFPHKDKLLAALGNPKAVADKALLEEALKAYETWIKDMTAVTLTGG